MRNEFLPGLGYFHHNADTIEITGTDRPWVFASGACGLTRSTLKLMDKSPKPVPYTVRLYFAETAPARPGQRVFDIKLQGKAAATDFDVLKSAERVHTALVKEFRRVPVTESLTIELIPKRDQPTVNQAPLLCAIEAVKEGT